MEMTVARFREEAAHQRGARPHGAAPYSDEQRAFATAYVQAGLAQGRSLTASAEALGVSEPTLRLWRRQAAAAAGPSTLQAAAAGPSTSLRRVVVSPTIEPARSSRLTLITPGGYRVRGLDVASAAALLRVLE